MTNKKTGLLLFILLLAVIGIFYAFRPLLERKNTPASYQNNSVKLDKLKVQAGWLLNGEFANVCSAIVNGYYKDERLDIELLPGGPTGASFIIATNAVAQNTNLDIAIDGDIVPLLRGVTKEAEQERLKVKAFAAFWQENPYGFIVKANSGLNSLKDFATKRKADGSKYVIGVTADSVAQYAIAQYAGVSVDDLNIKIVGFDATPFLAGQVDALAAFWTTQAYEVEKAGIDYKFLNLGEIPGFSQPSQVAIASVKTLLEKHDQLVRWVKATDRGSRFVIEHPAEAAQQILDPRCGGPTLKADQEEWLIRKSLTLFNQEKPSALNQEQLLDYAQSYYGLKQIPRVPAAEEIIDNSILNEVYR